jgi:DNA-binding MarR family transcriptional regulator
MMDGDVELIYARLGLPFRSRYTPIVKALILRESATIKELSEVVGLTHSAVSQTLLQMTRDGLVNATPGDDGRERVVRLTAAAKALLPQVFDCWDAFNGAVEDLSGEIGVPLADACERAISALSRKSFEARTEERLARLKKARGAKRKSL